MRKFKQLIIGIIIGAVIFGTIPAFATSRTIEVFFNNIKITLDGKEIKTDTEPFQYAGRTYVPIRFIAEAFGSEVKWNKTTNTVEIISSSYDDNPIYVPAPTITPTPTIPPTSTTPYIEQNEDKEVIVYITKTGEKYHRSGCRYLSRSRIPINLSDAKRRYSPCSVCNPPR